MAGGEVGLAEPDAHHLRVVRAGAGEPIEIVDAAGVVFAARVASEGRVQLERVVQCGEPGLPAIVLYAGVLAGQRWDRLVDGAVQAGATRIVPLVQSTRERQGVERRAERAARVVAAAAKQSKRTTLPQIAGPMRYADLPGEPPGIVCDERGTTALLEILKGPPRAGALSIVVGAASGLPRVLVEDLAAHGWRIALLGPTVLRSELAAAVAVSCAVQAQMGHAR